MGGAGDAPGAVSAGDARRRLRDDGSVPADNPFVGREEANPEIFTYGHRNATDFAWHPATGEGWATEIGPMVSPEQLGLVKELVEDAVANGATLHCGGPDEPFFRPAVLTGVTHDMRIMREEIFGPVVPIVVVDSEEEALERANDSNFGLGASVWTKDRAKGERMARQIESGMVWINDHSFTHGACQCSWGGVKDSGLGRSHSKFGFYECTNIKLVTWEPSRTRDFWWHPYDESLGKAMSASARLLYGRDADKPKALRKGLLPLMKVGRKSLRDVFRR